MKPATRRKIKKKVFELTKDILLLLLETPGELIDIFTEYPHYVSKHYPRNHITLKQIQRSLLDLKKQRLIQMKKYREQIKYELTDLGKAKGLKLLYKRRPKTVRTDGLSTIVIFDIPEEKKRARDFLRRFLKENGFTQLQKSVFIGRFKLFNDFRQILAELNINANVSILEGRVLHD